jgi:hypothetical protein
MVIRAEDLSAQIKILASDEFVGVSLVAPRTQDGRLFDGNSRAA